MALRTLLVLGVFMAAALLISARELAEETQDKKANEAGVQDQKYGGYNGGGGYPGGGYNGGGGYPGGGGGYHGGGGYPGGGGGYHGGGGYPGGGYHGGGGYPGGGGHRCGYGCCHRGNYGGCQCCSSFDEIPDAEYQAEVKF